MGSEQRKERPTLNYATPVSLSPKRNDVVAREPSPPIDTTPVTTPAFLALGSPVKILENAQVRDVALVVRSLESKKISCGTTHRPDPRVFSRRLEGLYVEAEHADNAAEIAMNLLRRRRRLEKLTPKPSPLDALDSSDWLRFPHVGPWTSL